MWMSAHKSRPPSAARWLARFHAFGPRSGPPVPIERVLRNTERRWRVIAELGGDMAAKSERLFRRLEAAARNLETPIVRPCHGDRSEERRVGKEGRARWAP